MQLKSYPHNDVIVTNANIANWAISIRCIFLIQHCNRPSLCRVLFFTVQSLRAFLMNLQRKRFEEIFYGIIRDNNAGHLVYILQAVLR
jgi:hypothetical protein